MSAKLAGEREAKREALLRMDPAQLKAAGVTGYEDPDIRDLMLVMYQLRQAKVPTLRPLLPLMLRLKGQPYTLDLYSPFEPIFRTHVATLTLLKCGRQLSKSTSLASQGIVQSNSIPYFSTLYITPLFEQIRRFSQNYVRPFIETSPVRALFSGTKTINSVLQRSFHNQSKMQFSFAYLDAERTRGISADKNVIDEIQELNYDFLSVIHETLSGSHDWGVIQYAGTPKSLDNTIEKLWGDSSMAEWFIKCPHGGCNHWNIPSIHHDLLGMLGPLRDDISLDRPATVCAKCRKPVDPRRGRWVHGVPTRRWDFAGYHVPQILMPMHYAVKKMWSKLLGKVAGRGNMTVNVLYNEVFGESFDAGSKLVTLTDLQTAACLPWKNIAAEARKQTGNYLHRVVAVDWGGGGEEEVSFTVVVVLGITAAGKVDVLWGYRITRLLDFAYEVKVILSAMGAFGCSHVAHDYNGVGQTREFLLKQAGLPIKNIVPIYYTGPVRQGFMSFHAPTERHPRHWYSLDRGRSLATVCYAIRAGIIRFFQYDHVSSDEPGLLHDFLALQEEETRRKTGANTYAIVRNPTMSDDFAHAVNMGANTLWYLTQKWPNFAEALKFTIPPDLLEFIHPAQPNWDLPV